MQSETNWIDSKGAAEYLELSDATLRKSRSTGTLLGKEAPKHTKYGGRIRYHLDDLAEFKGSFDSRIKTDQAKKKKREA